MFYVKVILNDKTPYRVNIWNRASVRRIDWGRRLMAPPSDFRKTFQPEEKAREFETQAVIRVHGQFFDQLLQRLISGFVPKADCKSFSESWGYLKKGSKCPTSELTMKAGFFFSILLSMLAQLSRAQYQYQYQTLLNYLESRLVSMEVRIYLQWSHHT